VVKRQRDGENVCQSVLVGWVSGLGFVFVIPLANKPTLLRKQKGFVACYSFLFYFILVHY
jgi:hypothetical protein